MKPKSRPGIRLVALNLVLVLLCTTLFSTMAFAATPYDIYVDNQQFKSTQDASGTGWVYSAKDSTLILNNYNGGRILASGGDLTIYSFGNSTVNGGKGSYLGSKDGTAIKMTNPSAETAYLDVYVMGGTLTVNGGQSATGAGASAIRADSKSDIDSKGNSFIRVTLQGGNLVANGGSGAPGGTAIFGSLGALVRAAEYYYVNPGSDPFYWGRYDDRNTATITGGASTSSKNTAGAGIFAPLIVLDVDGTVTGGKAATSLDSAPAVASLLGVIFGNQEEGALGSAMNLTLKPGREDGTVFDMKFSDEYTAGEHMNVDITYEGNGKLTPTSLEVYPKEYTTTFNGNGGTAASGNLPETVGMGYPYAIDFSKHAYTKTDSYLYGFTDSVSSNLVMTSDTFVPHANTTLTAKWAPYGNDTVLFLGNHGNFTSGSGDYVTKTVNSQYTVPTAKLTGYDLLGWCTAADKDRDPDTYFISPGAVWKAPGTETTDKTQAAYSAIWSNANNTYYVRYNGNGGLTANGSNMGVQGYNNDETATIADNFFTRDGYEFTGWSTSPNGGTTYTVGQKLDNDQNLELYAQWKESTKVDVSNQITFQVTGSQTYTGSPLALSSFVSPATFTGTPSGSGKITYLLDGQPATLESTVTNAGTYELTAQYEDDAQIGSKTVEITVNKATITVDGAAWNYTTPFTYDGNEKSVALTGLPDTVEASYTNATKTDAGTYTASATLSAKDPNNYTVSASIPDCEWVIQKASVDVPSAAIGLVFNGSAQTGVAVPAGALYTASNNVMTDAGDYTAILSLKNPNNYQWKVEPATSADQEVDWSIAKAAGQALTGSANIRFNVTDEQVLDLTKYLPNAGEITITDVVTDNANGALADDASYDGAQVTYRLAEGLTEENAGDTATLTITFDSQNYEESTMTWTITVMDKNDVSDQMTFEDGESVYTGLPQVYEEATCELTDGDITYTYSPEEVKNVGAYTVTATYEDAENRGTVTATFRITPAPLTITGATADDKAFDGSTAAQIHDVTFDGLVNEETLSADDYTVTSANFDSVHQGTDKTVSYAVTLAGSGTAANYALEEAAAETTASISRKPVTVTIAAIGDQTFNGAALQPAVLPVAEGLVDGYPLTENTDYTVSYENNLNAGTANVTLTPIENSDYRFDTATATFQILKAAMPTVQNVAISYKYDTTGVQSVKITGLPANCGTVNYAVGTVADDNAILSGTPTVTEDGTVSYTLAGKDLSAVGASATIPVTVSMQNYENVTVNVVVTLTEKNVPVLTVQDIEKVYNGESLTADDIRGTALFNGTTVDGTWQWVTDPATMVNANEAGYSATVQFTPTDTEAYAPAQVNLVVTIHKATPTGSPEYTSINTSGKTLADANLTAGNITPAGGTISWDLPGSTEVTVNTSYDWTYHPADSANYNDLTGSITVWRRSSGGGSSVANYNITIKDADNGSITADASSAAEGSTVTITAKPDDGYQLDTLTVTAKNGNSVKVKELSATKYTFTMPASGVTVEATFTAGDAPATPFGDVAENAWYFDAVKYVYDNGIMNGVKDDTFAPNNDLNRAMIAQILYNLEQTPETGDAAFDDVAANDWYADAVAWAAENEIVEGYGDGTYGPTNAITREQLATILFRYAQYKGMNTVTLEENLTGYADGDQVSSWAVSAMNWAVGNGILNGKGNNTLDPQGTATRAEVAQMLLNFDQMLSAQQ